MKTSEILLEKYINLLTPDQKQKYAKSVWDLIEKTYNSIGLNPRNTIDNLIQVPRIWKIQIQNNKILAGVIYKNFKGRKIRLVFHDNTVEGKNHLKQILKQDILLGRSWGEFSGPLEKIMIRLGGTMIPNSKAAEILGEPVEILEPDGFHYQRNIPGVGLKREVIIGNIQ